VLATLRARNRVAIVCQFLSQVSVCRRGRMLRRVRVVAENALARTLCGSFHAIDVIVTAVLALDEDERAAAHRVRVLVPDRDENGYGKHEKPALPCRLRHILQT